MKVQYIPKDLYDNTHKITVSVIGAGGTGSALLTKLGMINISLEAQGKKGLFVRCFDHDVVTESNMGRQAFNENDLGLNKADVLISKLNMFFGTQWFSSPIKVTQETINVRSNIIFICVDNVKAREEIYLMVKCAEKSAHEFVPYYVIDCGNQFKSGQIYLSNGILLSQPESKHETIKYIPDPFEKYGKGIYKDDEVNVPSCSIAQALGKQDLMINQFVADAAAKMLWDMTQNLFISYNEIFVNLENGIKIQTNKL